MAITSSSPGLPKPIAITVTSGVKGLPITIRNRTTGDTFYETLTTNNTTAAQHLVDLQNMTDGYTDGDIIDIMVGGQVMGHNSLTLSGDGGQSVTVSTTAVTTGVQRGIQ